MPKQGGGLVRLDNVVDVVEGQTASRIDRLDRQRTVSIRGSIAPGYALKDRLDALQRAFEELNLPATYTTKVSGRGRELERTFKEFLWAFVLSVIFMYMILASQYESLVHPFTILLSLPLSLPFALFSLWVTNNTLNLYSALGLLVLFGVVKKNSILQIDHANQLKEKGLSPHDARLARAYGYVFQAPALLPWRTVLSNVMLPLEIQGRLPEAAREVAREQLARVGLAQRHAAAPGRTVRRVTEPGLTRKIAVDALHRIDEGGAYANLVLPQMLQRTALDQRDRALVTEMVYGATRARRGTSRCATHGAGVPGRQSPKARSTISRAASALIAPASDTTVPFGTYWPW